jgi:hypothetical protein
MRFILADRGRRQFSEFADDSVLATLDRPVTTS